MHSIRYPMIAIPLLLAAAMLSPLHAKLEVVCTTPDYGALVTAVGGDQVKVMTLAKPTEDPHFVDAKPSHIVTMNHADLLVESGADLEIGWLPPLVAGARNRNVLPGAPGRFLAADGIGLLDVPATLDRSQGDVHAKGNPHFLMDPDNALVVARRLKDKLCELDGAGCAGYATRLQAFEAELGRKVTEWSAKLAPFRGRELVTYHNTWRYFANRFGLHADIFLEPKPGIPPSPPHLAQVIHEMEEKHVTALLVEPYQSRRVAETVASHAGATVVDVCQFPGGLGNGDTDYLSLMDANVNAIATALAAAPAE